MRIAIPLSALWLCASPALAFSPVTELPLGAPSLSSVAIDGPRLAVATGGTVEVHDFLVTPWFSLWLKTATLDQPATNPPNTFGTKLALSGDRLAVLESFSFAPRVHVFEKVSGQWVEVAAFEPPANTTFTASYGNDIELDGDFLVVAQSHHAAERGIVHVYRRGTNGVWAFHQSLASPISTLGLEFFGFDIELDGGRLAIGAPGGAVPPAFTPGRVYVYGLDPVGNFWLEDTFVEPGNDVPDNGFGRKLALAGNYLVVRSDLRHYRYVRHVVTYWWSPVFWPDWSEATPWEVSFQGGMRAADGQLVVGTGGAYGLDAALVYDLTTNVPTFQQLFFPAPAVPGFGSHVDVGGGRAVVAAGGGGVTGRLFVADP